MVYIRQMLHSMVYLDYKLGLVTEGYLFNTFQLKTKILRLVSFSPTEDEGFGEWSPLAHATDNILEYMERIFNRPRPTCCIFLMKNNISSGIMNDVVTTIE